MLIVQKYGGTSVGDPDRIRNVARRAVATATAGHRVAVVVSAMAGETNALVALAKDLGGEQPDRREYDQLVSLGENKTIALLAMAIQRLGHRARSFTGPQVRVETDGAHERARIQHIDKDRLLAELDAGGIAVVAGFQGIDARGDVTTLGRGGSDTSAVAIAAAIGADVCEIYTDVDGVYTADPNVVPSARKLSRVSFEEMLELASVGAKVLQIRSVKFAMRYGVPIHVRSSFSDDEGTWVVREEEVVEQLVVPSCETFWTIMSTTMPASESGVKIAAATPGESFTPRTRIFASFRLQVTPDTTSCSTTSSSRTTQVPSSSENDERTWSGTP